MSAVCCELKALSNKPPLKSLIKFLKLLLFANNFMLMEFKFGGAQKELLKYS